MILSLLNENVRVYRRISTATDSLGNPTYGDPITGEGWNLVYPCMPARLAFTDKKVEFAEVAERVKPYGTLYYSPDFALIQEDRIITPTGNQYVLTSIRVGYKTANIIDHYEGILELP